MYGWTTVDWITSQKDHICAGDPRSQTQDGEEMGKLQAVRTIGFAVGHNSFLSPGP